MAPYLKEGNVKICGADSAVAELAGRAVRGELSHAKAERLIGSVALLKHGGRAVYDVEGASRKINDRRSSRRLHDLREAGVVLADELPADAVVPVGELLREMVERFNA